MTLTGRQLILLLLPLLVFAGIGFYASYRFELNCEGHITRAANASTVEIAKTEIDIAIDYAEKNGLTVGNTAILVPTLDTDIGYWYLNLMAVQGELNKVTPETSLLERSNLLIRLRESLGDVKDGSMRATIPSGLSLYPHNRLFAGSIVGYFALVFLGFIVAQRRRSAAGREILAATRARKLELAARAKLS